MVHFLELVCRCFVGFCVFLLTKLKKKKKNSFKNAVLLVLRVLQIKMQHARNVAEAIANVPGTLGP